MSGTVLVITNSSDATADHLCSRMDEADVPLIRLNTDELTRLAQIEGTAEGCVLRIHGYSFRPEDFSTIWFRRPEELKIDSQLGAAEVTHIRREWAEAFEGYLSHIPHQRWINHPVYNALASHKLEQLSRAKKAGFVVPATFLAQSKTAVQSFFERERELVVKPLAAGYLERDKPENDSLIYTSAVSEADIESFPTDSVCPTLFQRRIDKAIDVRVCVVDQAVHTVGLEAFEEDGEQRLDIRRYNMADVRYREIDLPPGLRSKILNYVRSYSLRFAALDFAISKSGDWIFFEVNPNGQWAWLDQAGVTDIAGAFIRSFKA